MTGFVGEGSSGSKVNRGCEDVGVHQWLMAEKVVQLLAFFIGCLLLLVKFDKVVFLAVGCGQVTGKWRDLLEMREKNEHKISIKAGGFGFFLFCRGKKMVEAGGFVFLDRWNNATVSQKCYV